MTMDAAWNGTEVARQMPTAAAGAAAGVIIYTVICLLAGLTFIFHVLHHDCRFLYVSMFAYGSTLICFLSLVQEINYVVNWFDITVDVWDSAKVSALQPDLSFGPQAGGLFQVLFWLLIYLLDVCALIVTFWAVTLCTKTWQWHFGPLRKHHEQIAVGAKVFAVVAPLVYIIVRATTILEAPMPALIVYNYFFFFFSFSLTTISVILIAVKYFITSLAKRGFAMRSNSKLSNTGSQNGSSPNVALIDQFMIRRFIIAAVIVCAYNMYVIFYSTNAYISVLLLALAEMPDFSAHTTIVGLVSFIPLTTLTLLGFLLFGTTRQALDQYSAAMTNLRDRMPWRRRATSPGGESIYGLSTTGTSVAEVEKGSRTLIVHTSV